ncbi:DUF1684 domain-containing protein [soil metagenome]
MKLLMLLLITTILTNDYTAVVEAHRKQKNEDFRVEGKSPLLTKKERKKFVALHYFTVDEQYKVVAKYLPLAQEDTLEFMTSSGKIKMFAQVATLQFTLQGQSLSLPAYQGIEIRKKPGNEKHLFIPFTDGTTGAESYGAGRYLDLELPEGDTLTLDFNYAYNPLCAYTSGYSCPIPKPASRLPVRIEVGEKVYH